MAAAATTDALTFGYQRALLVCSVFALATALVAIRTRGVRATPEPIVIPTEAAAQPRCPATGNPERTDQ